MVAYSIGIIPLNKNLKAEFDDITQPWYDYNVGVLGTFSNVKIYLISQNDSSWDVGITLDPLKAF